MSDRKKILYVASRVPFPPNKGEKIRTFRCLDHLAASHDVYCAFFTDGPEDNAHIESLRQWCVDVAAIPRPPRPKGLDILDLLSRGYSVSMFAHRSEALSGVIRRWRQRIDFDVAVAFSAFMGPYALAAGAGRTVLDLCDCDSEKWRDYAANSIWPLSSFWRMEADALKEVERSLASQFDAAIVINERERRVLGDLGNLSTISVLPNGVDRPRWQPPSPSAIGPVVTFIGALDYRPNIDGVKWFASKVWPRIHQANRDALFLIAGHRPTSAVKRLGEVPGVRMLGAFESLDELLSKSRVIVAPLRVARGMQNKVLEAMAWRRPVVATRAVSAGLCDAHGERLISTDSPIQMSDSVIALLNDGKRADAIADRGLRYVSAFHRWPEHLATFERIILNLGRHAAPAFGPTERATLAATSIDRTGIVPNIEETIGVAHALAGMADGRVPGTPISSVTADETNGYAKRKRRHFSVSAFVESAT